MVQLKEDCSSWDNRTNTLTFDTFRPSNWAAQDPVPNGHYYYSNAHLPSASVHRLAPREPPPYSHALRHSALNGYPPPEPQGSLPVYTYVEMGLSVRLLDGETRVGFSMAGGRNESWPSVVNNLLHGSPADRAGLAVGDEIIEVNGISVERATHAQIVQLIHQCIKSRTIQLRVRRKQSQSPNGDVSSIQFERQLSDDAGQRVTDAYLISVNPVERADLAHQLQHQYPGVRTIDMESLHSHLQTSTDSPRLAVSAAEIPYSAAPHKPPVDINQNNAIRYMNGSLQSNGEVSEEELEQQRRMAAYEDDLKRRRDRQDKYTKEQEFLRSSLRGSKKLHALEQDGSDQEAGCHENPLYSRDDVHSHGEETLELRDVLVSVERVTTTLDKHPEHRRDSKFINDLFAEKEVQSAIDLTVSVQKHWNEKAPALPTTVDAFASSDGVLQQLGDSISNPAAELQQILENPHLQAALYTHDRIGDKLHQMEPGTSKSVPNGVRHTQSVLGLKETVLDASQNAGNLRIVKLMKQDDHYLGATVKNEGERIVIGRIVKGGVAEKSRLLQEGDELLEVNGVDLRGKSVNEVCDLLRSMTGELTFIMSPGETSAPDSSTALQTEKAASTAQPVVRHMRALFDYEPEDDFYVPCRELALKFQKGDIIHVINMSDANWWQAYREGDDPTAQTLAGLVPSSTFHTQRELYKKEVLGETGAGDDEVSGGLICTKRSKKQKKGVGKVTHLGAQNGTVPTSPLEPEILTYEQVSLYLSRTGRKRPVVLVGPSNVGCLELRQKLMDSDKEKFAPVLPHTSRSRRQEEQDGVHYNFVSKQKFQEDVAAGKFVEWGEFERNYYGTTFDAIRRVVSSGKIAVLNLKAQSLKSLRASNLMPYVVFISPPSLERLRINRTKLKNHSLKEEDLKGIIQEARETEEAFGHLFDKVIVNIDLERSFTEFRNAIHRLETEPHWVPSHWLQYDSQNNNNIS